MATWQWRTWPRVRPYLRFFLAVLGYIYTTLSYALLPLHLWASSASSLELERLRLSGRARSLVGLRRPYGVLVCVVCGRMLYAVTVTRVCLNAGATPASAFSTAFCTGIRRIAKIRALPSFLFLLGLLRAVRPFCTYSGCTFVLRTDAISIAIVLSGSGI
jgi:hypothetical protein